MAVLLNAVEVPLDLPAPSSLLQRHREYQPIAVDAERSANAVALLVTGASGIAQRRLELLKARDGDALEAVGVSQGQQR